MEASGEYVKKSKFDNHMKAAPSRPVERKMYNTWDHYLQGLKPAWNGNRRLAIDVPGDGSESHCPDENVSWANQAEVRLACDLVKGAIETDVPANGVSLTCANFLGVVIHGAQEGVITETMFVFEIKRPGKRVTMKNIGARQGSKCEIVLLFFAHNIPNKPLDTSFTAENRSLHTTLSRAKQATVVVGDIRAWFQERNDDKEVTIGDKNEMSHFGTYIQDIIEQKVAISYGDVQRFLDGDNITEAELPELLKP